MTSKQTAAVHGGERSSHNPGVVNTINPSTAFHFSEAANQFYPRYFNTPNQQIIVDKLCELENAEAGIVFSSGMAAISTTLMALLKPGDHAVMLNGLYGGTHSFVCKEFDDAGIQYTFASGDVASLTGAMQDNTRMVFVETPANPLLDVVDLRGLSDAVAGRNALTVVDNTFASPINQNPLDQGFDISIHSGTKYLGGHSDLTFGAVLGHAEPIELIRQKAINYGGCLNGLTCYLIERSLKTLAVRVERQSDNALEVARYLAGQAAVDQVFYPGLETHPDHQLAARQMTGFGGMLSFNLDGAVSYRDFLGALKLITPATSLGGVESTMTMPVFTSHRLMPEQTRQQLGITERLVRFSVGIESANDLIADLEQALARCLAGSEAGAAG